MQCKIARGIACKAVQELGDKSAVHLHIVDTTGVTSESEQCAREDGAGVTDEASINIGPVIK